MYRKMIKVVFYARMEETEEMGTKRSRILRIRLSKRDKEVKRVE